MAQGYASKQQVRNDSGANSFGVTKENHGLRKPSNQFSEKKYNGPRYSLGVEHDNNGFYPALDQVSDLHESLSVTQEYKDLQILFTMLPRPE